jgi:hypothetical protein
MNTDMTPDELMDRAADYINTHGWCRGVMYRKTTGNVCVGGALYAVTFPSLTLLDLSAFSIPDVLAKALRFMGEANIVYWNDTLCKDGAQASELLRSEAKRYREETTCG